MRDVQKLTFCPPCDAVTRTTSPAATLHVRNTSAFITILRAALEVEHEGSVSSTLNNFVDSDVCAIADQRV